MCAPTFGCERRVVVQQVRQGGGGVGQFFVPLLLKMRQHQIKDLFAPATLHSSPAQVHEENAFFLPMLKDLHYFDGAIESMTHFKHNKR